MNNKTTIDNRELKRRLEALQQLAAQGFDNEEALKALEIAALDVFKATVVLQQPLQEIAQVAPVIDAPIATPEVQSEEAVEEIEKVIDEVAHEEEPEALSVAEHVPEEEAAAEEPAAEANVDEVSEVNQEEPSEPIEEKKAERVEDAKAEINQSFTTPKEMGDGISYSPIDNLKKAIGLNDRFMFANELFNGFGEEYAKAIEEFNHLESMADAERLIEAKFAPKYHWDNDDETVQLFKRFLYRRYLANS